MLHCDFLFVLFCFRFFCFFFLQKMQGMSKYVSGSCMSEHSMQMMKMYAIGKTKACTNWSALLVLPFSWTEVISICLVFSVVFNKNKGKVNQLITYTKNGTTTSDKTKSLSKNVHVLNVARECFPKWICMMGNCLSSVDRWHEND